MPASVTVQCNGCQATRVIGPGEVGANDFPMCTTCYLPMCAVEARSEPESLADNVRRHQVARVNQALKR